MRCPPISSPRACSPMRSTKMGTRGDYMDTWTAMLDADVTFDVGQSVTVSANGSADVKVTVKLTDAQKAALNDKYPSGAYIQGFVYAKSGATTEGAEGTEHSIPVLGFYGNWSDGSMFEVGSPAGVRHKQRSAAALFG